MQSPTFGHELPQPLNLDGHSVKPPKAKPQSPNPTKHATLFLAKNNPSNLTAKILSMIGFLMKKKPTASQP
jgi:hypothetical protein